MMAMLGISRAGETGVLALLAYVSICSFGSLWDGRGRPSPQDLCLCIPIVTEPDDRFPQRFIHRNMLPSQLSLRFGGRYEHFLSSHADRINRRARLASANTAGDNFI